MDRAAHALAGLLLSLAVLGVPCPARAADPPDVTSSALARLDEEARRLNAAGRWAEARARAAEALEIAERSLGPESPAIAERLDTLGVLTRKAGDLDAAEPLYRRALALKEKAAGPEHPDVARTLHNLAALLTERGDLAAAEPLYRRALAIRERALGPEHPLVALSLDNLAALLADEGDLDAAEPLCRRALSIREKALAPDAPDLARSLDNLAVLLHDRGQLAEAAPLAQRALILRVSRLGPEHPDVALSLANLASLQRDQGRLDDALGNLRRAIAIREKVLGPDHPDLAISLMNLGTMLRDAGDDAGAEAHDRRAIDLLERALGPDHPRRTIALEQLAALQMARGRTGEARDTLNQAASAADRSSSALLAAFPEHEKLVLMAGLARGTSLVLSLHLAARPSDPEAAELALRTLLRRKGRVVDVLGRSFAALRARLDPEDQALLARLGVVDGALARMAARAEPEVSPDERRARRAALVEEKDRIEDAISRRASPLALTRKLVEVGDVRRALPAGAALVELAVYSPFDPARRTFGASRYAAYVLGREGPIRAADLGEAGPIDALAQKLRYALAHSHVDPTQLARALDEEVMRPIRALLGDARWIFLAPDGALALVPPGALMDEEGHWLIERFAFVDLTSGRDLLHFGSAPARAPSAPLLLGDPAFGPIGGARATARAADVQAQDVRGRRSIDMTMVQFGALPGTAAETSAIARLLPDARVLLGEEATEAAVERARGPRVLHLATHGFFLPDAPADHPPALEDMPRAGYAENPLLRAGLALAGANARASGGDDGILTALEVSALDLDATRLVVLSACETGLGDVQRGEGVLGLRRAFLLAGAETLVTSLWKVDDRATRALMIDYHERLRAGEGRAEALRRAQLLMHQPSATAHPYFWAAFIASGSPASLDGHLTPPALPRAGPGLRGCGCAAAGAEGSDHGTIVLAAIGAMAFLRGRRRRRA